MVFAFAGTNWHQSKSPLHSFWHLISLSNPPEMCHVRMAFPKPLPSVLLEHYSNMWSASGLSLQETFPLAIFLCGRAQDIETERKMLLNLFQTSRCVGAFTNSALPFWPLSFFLYSTTHLLKLYSWPSVFEGSSLLHLSKVSNAPYMWQATHSDAFLIPQQGSAAAQSNLCARNTSPCLRVTSLPLKQQPLSYPT